MRLLLVEDDEILGDGLVAGLKMEGYAVDWLTSGKLADEALKLNSYELIVLIWACLIWMAWLSCEPCVAVRMKPL